MVEYTILIKRTRSEISSTFALGRSNDQLNSLGVCLMIVNGFEGKKDTEPIRTFPSIPSRLAACDIAQHKVAAPAVAPVVAADVLR